jgi:hypothetical protein
MKLVLFCDGTKMWGNFSDGKHGCFRCLEHCFGGRKRIGLLFHTKGKADCFGLNFNELGVSF